MKRLQKWQLTPSDKKALRVFLSGKEGLRPTAKKLGCSHTQVVNLVCTLAREQYQKGKFTV